MSQTLSEVLSRKLKPTCPRDNRVMRLETRGIRWKDNPASDSQIVASYHCDFEGCSVRYNNSYGYFTVIGTPDQPYFLEEPGVNILQCPRHGTWLYRCKGEPTDGGFHWRCGVDGCDYAHTGISGPSRGR